MALLYFNFKLPSKWLVQPESILTHSPVTPVHLLAKLDNNTSRHKISRDSRWAELCEARCYCAVCTTHKSLQKQRMGGAKNTFPYWAQQCRYFKPVEKRNGNRDGNGKGYEFSIWRTSVIPQLHHDIESPVKGRSNSKHGTKWQTIYH